MKFVCAVVIKACCWLWVSLSVNSVFFILDFAMVPAERVMAAALRLMVNVGSFFHLSIDQSIKQQVTSLMVSEDGLVVVFFFQIGHLPCHI